MGKQTSAWITVEMEVFGDELLMAIDLLGRLDELTDMGSQLELLGRDVDVQQTLLELCGPATFKRYLDGAKRQEATLARIELDRVRKAMQPQPSLPNCAGFQGVASRCTACRVHKNMHA